MAITRDELKKLELTDDQISKVLDMHHAEIDPVKGKAEQYDKVKEDFDKQAEKIKALEGNKGDAEKLQAEIEKLKTTAAETSEAHKKAMEDMESKLEDTKFSGLLDKAITASGAKRATAVRAELNLDELKASKNQEKDINDAIKELREAEDTSFLFNAQPTGDKKNVPGVNTNKDDGGDKGAEATARAVMGLPPIESKEK